MNAVNLPDIDDDAVIRNYLIIITYGKIHMKLTYLTIILILFNLSGCGERDVEEIAEERDPELLEDRVTIPDSEQVLYTHKDLGFGIEGKHDWQVRESTERQNDKNMVLLSLTKNDRSVDVRSVDAGWSGLMPLVRLDQRARDEQKDIQIGEVQGVRTHLQRFGNDYVRIERNNVVYEITGKPDDVDAVLEEFHWFEPVIDEPDVIAVEEVRMEDLPDTVRRWIDNLMQLDMVPLAESMTYTGKQYVFASWGTRPTGGYDVKIRDAIIRDDDKIYVRLAFTSPGPDEMVTQAITHPYTMGVIEDPETPVEFERYYAGEPRNLARIRGIDALPDIQAGSKSIKIFSPAPESQVEDPVQVTGIANVHEANVEYRVLDETGQVIKDGFTTAAIAYEWGYFEFDISIGEYVESGDSFTIELFYTDMKDGKRSDIVSIPLYLK